MQFIPNTSIYTSHGLKMQGKKGGAAEIILQSGIKVWCAVCLTEDGAAILDYWWTYWRTFTGIRPSVPVVTSVRPLICDLARFSATFVIKNQPREQSCTCACEWACVSYAGTTGVCLHEEVGSFLGGSCLVGVRCWSVLSHVGPCSGCDCKKRRGRFSSRNPWSTFTESKDWSLWLFPYRDQHISSVLFHIYPPFMDIQHFSYPPGSGFRP